MPKASPKKSSQTRSKNPKTATKPPRKSVTKRVVDKKTPKADAAAQKTSMPAAKPSAKKDSSPKSVKNYFYANGKRKTSIASVRLFEGKGSVTINNRTFNNYFPIANDQDKILAPLKMSNCLKTFDISVRVRGGGIHSQAEAIRHGISKALLLYNAELRNVLKPVGFLTRDSRVKERKKYGLKRARRAPQWQKR